MPKSSAARLALPSDVEQVIAMLGRDIAIARKRRRIPLRAMADKMMTSVDTIQRLEKGDPGVGIGIVGTALWVLGMHRRLAEIIAPDTDQLGMHEDIRGLPLRVRGKRAPKDDIASDDGNFDF
jgi:transcriptional regulator with XRE-family HTH domain